MALCVAVGFTVGAVAGALILIGPGGFRPPAIAIATASPPTTSTPSAATPSAPPTRRSYAAMAFDAAIGEMVLFGGFEANTWQALGDTWTWNGKRWERKPRADSDPLPRISATMTYDVTHKVIVMRGGIDNAFQFLDETWTWDGNTWKKMAPAQSPPKFTAAVEPMVWDSKLNRVLLFAMTKDPYTQYNVPPVSQLWTWDGTNWSVLDVRGAPSGYETYDAAMAYDSSRQQAVFFAHAGGGGTPTTWTFDGSSWTQVSGTGPRPNVDGWRIAPDARSSVVMLDGELNTWRWDGSQWNLLAPAHSPGASSTFAGVYGREGAAIAYDSTRKVVVVFGGARGIGRTAEFNDTWTWNGSDWTQAG